LAQTKAPKKCHCSLKNPPNQAVSNANDAVSEAQTTAGALNTIVNNLQSIRTLAVESANGSNSASDRS
jgi:flagellin